MSASYQFLEHALAPADLLWLTEVARSPNFSPRMAKIKLFDKLPRGFSPDRIDMRFYVNDHLTPLGLRRVDPSNDLFRTMDLTVRIVRARILKDPHVSQITADEIAGDTGLTSNAVGASLYALGEVGRFFSGASGPADNTRLYNSIQFGDHSAFDGYLEYVDLDTLFEAFYVQRAKAFRLSPQSYSARGPWDLPTQDSAIRRNSATFDSGGDDDSEDDPEGTAALTGWFNAASAYILDGLSNILTTNDANDVADGSPTGQSSVGQTTGTAQSDGIQSGCVGVATREHNSSGPITSRLLAQIS